MKRKYSYFDGEKQTDREYSYIPVRYILAVMITFFEVLAVIGIVVFLCYYVPYFYPRLMSAGVRIFAPML